MIERKYHQLPLKPPSKRGGQSAYFLMNNETMEGTSRRFLPRRANARPGTWMHWVRSMDASMLRASTVTHNSGRTCSASFLIRGNEKCPHKSSPSTKLPLSLFERI